MSDNKMTVWEPKPYGGSDLLPVQVSHDLVDNIPVVGRESTTDEDVKIPTLKLLHGQSDEVTEGIPGASPGKLFLTSTKEVIEPPIRTLVVSHSRSNVLYPKPDDSRYAGLQQCIAKDGIEGTVYGFCDDCRRHKQWDGRKPPVCAETHNFTVLTQRGPAVIRFKRSSFPTARDFVSTWRLGHKNLWHHPVEIRVASDTYDLDGKKTTFFYLKMQWIIAEAVPPEIHRKAYDTWAMFNSAADEGRLKVEEDNE